jgi:large subunit ribosomal protein L10
VLRANEAQYPAQVRLLIDVSFAAAGDPWLLSENKSLYLADSKVKTFYFTGRKEVNKLAFTKDEKKKIMEQYENWLAKSQAIFMLEYSKMTMKDVDNVRAKAREVGAEMHVVKNTLFGIIMDQLGMDGKKLLDNTTLVGFAFNDAPALAKVVNDATKGDIFKVKGGMLGKRTMSVADVKALADMPPLPVVRAQLLGVLSAPASKLVRTINEPARGLAAVIKAHSEKSGESAGEPSGEAASAE